jgi:hypothetical protein
MKRDFSAFVKVLNIIGKIIPGEHLKTSFYLNFIAKPRKFLRKSINGFYRIEHIYEVLEEFKKHYYGKFSILEFGVADGYSYVKHLYATKHLKLNDRVIVHGFDTFEGLPERDESTDGSTLDSGRYVEGIFRGRYDELLSYCRRNFNNFNLHKGLFDETIAYSYLD